MSALLTTLEHKGGQGVLGPSATLAERNALALHLMALRAQGHAVQADAIHEYGDEGSTIRAFHYLSCEHPKCKGRAI